MKISYNWLGKYIQPLPPAEQTAELLTNCGLEVESSQTYENFRGGLEGLVVGYVVECEKHPQADRLSLTKTDCGAFGLKQIVCGAPNVKVGQHVIVALPGVTLYPSQGEPFTIKESKIRGELSQGMLCAEDEIGLGGAHEGIMVLPGAPQPGTPLTALFQVYQDTVFEIGLTPNRIDAASHFGVARDLRAVLYKNPEITLTRPAVANAFASNEPGPVKVEVRCHEALSRYSGVCVDNVSVAESPDWLKNALKTIGLKPINNVVDISNYVLHETGQPLHIFDLDAIDSGVVRVQTLPAGTSFQTLDGAQRTLQESDLMICNADQPMCIAGVFGGLKSGVQQETKRLFIESARFNPTWVRKTARHHNLNTDASFRFERGSDPEITIYALQRTLDLLFELTGGKQLGAIADWYPEPQPWTAFFYPWWKLDRLVGFTIPRNEAVEILRRLEIEIVDETPEGLSLRIPPFKADVTTEADVTEEILRIYGYNQIPLPEKLTGSFPSVERPDVWKLKNHLSDHLAAIGFAEVLNNSLAPSALADLLANEQQKPVFVLNPLSQELNVLRNSAFYGLCETISWNRNRQQQDLAIFEWGKTYLMNQEGKYTESQFLAIAQSGFTSEENWNRPQQKSAFTHLKGALERLFELLGIGKSQVDFESFSHALLEEALSIRFEGKTLGCIGRIGRELSKRFDLDEPVWTAELNWEMLLQVYQLYRIKYTEVSKFPQVRRDLSLLLNQDVSFSELRKAAQNSEKKLLQEVQLFDVYSGKNLPPEKKSYAISFTFLDREKTLTDEQVNKAMQRIIQSYNKLFGAELRG